MTRKSGTNRKRGKERETKDGIRKEGDGDEEQKEGRKVSRGRMSGERVGEVGMNSK